MGLWSELGEEINDYRRKREARQQEKGVPSARQRREARRQEREARRQEKGVPPARQRVSSAARTTGDLLSMLLHYALGFLIGLRVATLLFPTDVLLQIGIALVSGVGALSLWERFTASGRRIAALKAARKTSQ